MAIRGSVRVAENTKTFLRENPRMALEIEKAIRENAGLVADHLLVEPVADAEGEPPSDVDDNVPVTLDASPLGAPKPARAKKA
jgi:hypothetical protein